MAIVLFRTVVHGKLNTLLLTDWVKVLVPLDREWANLFGLVLKTLSHTQQKEATQKWSKKTKNTQNAKPKQIRKNEI